MTGGRLSPQETEVLRAAVPSLPTGCQLEPLSGGFSADEKYVVWEAGQPKHLLRLAAPERLSRKREELSVLERLRGRGVLCPEPIDAGLTTDGSRCYLITGYIVGDQARAVIGRLSMEQQAEAGRVAGEQLRMIHDTMLQGLPEGLEPWRARVAEIIATHDWDGGGAPAWFSAAA